MDGAEQLFRLGKAAAGRVGDDGLGAVGVRAVGVGEQRAVLVGEQEAGHDGVDAQLGAELGGKLGGHVLGVAGDGRLGGAVAYHAGQRAQGGLGAEVDDGAFLVLRHDGHEDRGGQDGAEQVEVDHLAEGVDVQIEERLVRRDGGSRHVASGGVEQDVDGAEACHDVALVLLQRVFVEYVGGEEQGFADGVQFGFEGAALFCCAVEYDNLGALSGQVFRDVLSQDAATAGDDGYFSFDVE